jgi:hypothetical protein
MVNGFAQVLRAEKRGKLAAFRIEAHKEAATTPHKLR